MRRFVGFGFVIAMVLVAEPVYADNDSGTFFVPLAGKTEVVYVVHATPAFDGTGEASRRRLDYAPYDGIHSWGPGRDRSNYYQAVWEIR